MKKLDIIYLFNKIIREEKMEKNYNLLDIQFNMSEECKKELYNMNSSDLGLK